MLEWFIYRDEFIDTENCLYHPTMVIDHWFIGSEREYIQVHVK